MNYVIIFCVLGAALGAFSSLRPKAFTMFLLMSILLGLIYLQFGGARYLVVEFSGVRNVKAIGDVFQDLFNRLSKEGKLALILSPAAFLGARILTWLKLNFFTREETDRARRKRVLKEFGA